MIIAVDVETYDPNLKTRGDGALRSFPNSWDYDESQLLMCAWHDGERGKCCYPYTDDWEQLKRMLADPSVDKVFHNGVYDLSWLQLGAGLEVKGNIHDTMTRAAYIDEYQDLNLDACCNALGVAGKNKGDTIEAWYKEHIEDVRSVCRFHSRTFRASDALWKHTAFLLENFEAFRIRMEEYNMQDVIATWNLYWAQEPLMQPVYSAYMVDVQLTPLIIEMKKTGVLIDRERMRVLTHKVSEDYAATLRELADTYGIEEEELLSPKKLGERLNQMGLHSPVRTAKGAESWAVGALNRVHHPVVRLIQEARGYSKLLGTYLEGSLKDAVMSDSRIHCTFTPNKRDDGGTVTGRFSCSKPNLQQIPSRDKATGHSYGQDMRRLFLPEEGCMMAALDYSQIEYLLLAHYAVGKQAEWLREQAISGVDFHDTAMKMTGIPSRKVVKAFNYGVIYGMGWKTAMQNNYVLFEAAAMERKESIEKYSRDVYNSYHARLPVIKDTMEHVQREAKRKGYVTTFAGRRLHCPKPRWDSERGEWNDGMYKMLNKLIQGSAADILKKAMLEIAGAMGPCDRGQIIGAGWLHLTVHDELVFSMPYGYESGVRETQRLIDIMEGAYREELKVPMKVDCEVGPDWGYWKPDIWEEMKDGKFGRRDECWWGKG